jgi:hypothetical protein
MKHACLVLAVLIVAGPINTHGSQRSADRQSNALDKLLRAESKWRASKIDEYQFRFQYTCGMAPPPPPDAPRIFMRVKAGKSAYLRPGATPVPVPAELVQYATVEKLFAFIRNAWTRRPFDVDVQYDQARGYPIHVCVNPAANVSDDEYGFLIKDFSVLSNAGQ